MITATIFAITFMTNQLILLPEAVVVFALFTQHMPIIPEITINTPPHIPAPDFVTQYLSVAITAVTPHAIVSTPIII